MDTKSEETIPRWRWWTTMITIATLALMPMMPEEWLMILPAYEEHGGSMFGMAAWMVVVFEGLQRVGSRKIDPHPYIKTTGR